MFVTLGIQHAMRIRRIILLSVVCLALSHSSTLSHKRHEFRKKYYTKCVFWFSLQLFSEIFLILRNVQRDIILFYIGLHVKRVLFLSDLNET